MDAFEEAELARQETYNPDDFQNFPDVAYDFCSRCGEAINPEYGCGYCD